MNQGCWEQGTGREREDQEEDIYVVTGDLGPLRSISRGIGLSMDPDWLIDYAVHCRTSQWRPKPKPVLKAQY